MSSPQTRRDLPASTAVPQSHHLDRRADEVAAQGAGDPDDLLTTPEEALWLGVSRQWLEIGRTKGWGPPFIRLGPQIVRYRRGDTLRWLEERLHRSTAEYQK